jgi:hypothetical protein
MPVINGIALGVSILNSYAGYPIPATYTGIKVYGANIIDHVHIKNVLLTQTEIANLQLYTAPVWDGNTILLANFANNFNAGNITGLVNPITTWVFQRRKTTETTFTTLATLPSTTTQYIDATAEPNVDYIYQVLAKNATEISEPLVNTLSSNFYNCVLSSLDGSEAYIFDLNLDFGGLQEVVAFQQFDGYNEFPSFSFGEMKYREGDVEAILASDYSGIELIQTVDYLKAFSAFINNKQEKIFKDRKGNVLKVVTTGGVKQAPLNIAIGAQPYTVNFNFKESGVING